MTPEQRASLELANDQLDRIRAAREEQQKRLGITEEELSEPEPGQDLIAPSDLFVCDQMGAHLTRVRLEHPSEQEPVAWQDTEKHSELVSSEDWENIDQKWRYMYRPLYTAPLPRREWVGLTEDEVVDLLPVGDWEIEPTLDIARAIEAKLKEKNA